MEPHLEKVPDQDTRCILLSHDSEVGSPVNPTKQQAAILKIKSDFLPIGKIYLKCV